MDLESLRNLCGSLSGVTNNLNQIVKRVDQTGVIYKSDIDDMKKSIDKILKEQGDIHLMLLKGRK